MEQKKITTKKPTKLYCYVDETGQDRIRKILFRKMRTKNPHSTSVFQPKVEVGTAYLFDFSPSTHPIRAVFG